MSRLKTLTRRAQKQSAKDWKMATEQHTKLVAVMGDEDTVTGFILAGVGNRTAEGTNFLVVKPGECV